MHPLHKAGFRREGHIYSMASLSFLYNYKRRHLHSVYTLEDRPRGGGGGGGGGGG